jgi:ABC-type glycerol-3-phosphate transport system substrate-binding protein
VVLVLALAACNTARRTSTDAGIHGVRLQVLAVWAGAEQRRFREVLDAFERETGATVTYISAGHRIADELADRRARGTLPDVAFIPQPGLLRQYARDGVIVPIAAEGVREVDRNYSPIWQTLGSVDGRQYGVWFKAANKSLVWYSVGAFERAGVVPPATLDGFAAVAGRITASGTPAFSLGAADGWTLTDWFENVYLAVAGVDRYDRLAAHRLAWTDPSVEAALRLLVTLWAPPNVAGGADSARRTSFETSVSRAFARPPTAAMVVEGDFVQGLVVGDHLATPGVDVDVFAFPAGPGTAPEVVGGGDAAVALRDTPAAQALLRFLATPRAASIWAAHGGFVSPNANVDLAVYPDVTSRAIARRLIEAGDRFRFDLSDLQPAAFGGVEGSGMRGALQELLTSRDVEATAARLEADATAAHGTG